jgi:uncharacterized protein
VIERPRLRTADGVDLEAKVDVPEEPAKATVLCHPHPQYGGTMHSPLMVAIARVLVDRGHVVVRFNFRGSGESEGAHDDGGGELEDVAAAVAHAGEYGLPLSIAGWSFGGRMALTWLASSRSEMPYVGVAPQPVGLPEQLPPGPKRIILGTRDQVIDGEELRRYAVEKGIDLVLTPGDHFFHGRGERIGALVAQGME